MKTLTGKSPRQQQRIQSLMIMRLSFRFERLLAKEITRAMRDGTKRSVQLAMIEHERRLNIIMREVWIKATADFDSYFQPLAQRASGKKNVMFATPNATGAMMAWINTNALQKISQITDTTRHDIDRVIQIGMDEGLGEIEIAQMINKIAPIKALSRAQTIARTEVGFAASFTAQANAEIIGVEFKRQWVASQTERTRQTHRDADGQIVGMNEPFIVGGVNLMFPSDQNANAPQETINCRCAVAYVL